MTLSPAQGESAAIERARLAVILTTIGMSVCGMIVFSRVAWSDWWSAVLLNLSENALLIGFILRRRDRLFPQLILFGLAVGMTELLADAWLVAETGTLDYTPGGGPMIWLSPFWMPLAWQMVAVQFGYLGIRLTEWRMGLGLLLIGVLGAVNIPFYEEMALWARWWRYQNCRMLLHTPYYIILGEFLIAMCLAALARVTRSGRWSHSLGAGIAAGLAIFACYVAGYVLIESGR
jgi:hypothetical protein